MIRDLLAGFTDLVYPACCILCKNHLGPLEKTPQLCFACQSKLEKNHPPFCRRCSRPLENPAHHFCRNCQTMPLEFNQAWGVFLYIGTMQKLLHLFKYGHKTSLRHFFFHQINVFSQHYNLNISAHDLIVPIPLHSTRQRERGYNQSLLIARMLSEEFNIPLINDNLIRVRHTPNQARLSQKERWTNIEAAFKMNRPNTFRHKNILLVDDLYTTGATVSQAAKVLKTAQAKTINVLTIAIAAQAQTQNNNKQQ